MIARPFSQVFILLGSVLWAWSCLDAESVAAQGVWSREAMLLEYLRGTRRVEVTAPDRRKIVRVLDVSLAVEMDGRRLSGIEDTGVSTLAELAWSPDSTAFFITESYGGQVGDWHVRVFMIEKERIHRVDVTQEVVKQFKKHYKCGEPEEPNVGAVKWLKGSKELLVVAEVPPHSSCPEMGKVRGYVVEVPGRKIIQQFDETELRFRWSRHLGQRFSNK